MKSSFRNLREIEYPKCFGTSRHYDGAINLVNKDDSEYGKIAVHKTLSY